MGLPMYRDPDEATFEDNVAKVERAAAISRSRIRRETPVRFRRYAHPDRPQRRELAGVIPERQRPHRSPFVDANDEIQHLEAELEQFRHRILTNTRPGPGTSRELAPMSRATPQDAFLSTNTRDRVDPLPRESALRFELGGRRAPVRSGSISPSSLNRSRDLWMGHHTRPPHSIESSGRVRAPRNVQAIVPDGPLDDDSGFTRNFAPARGPYSSTPQPSEGMTRTVMSHRSDNSADQPPDLHASADTPPPETWQASYPPLRRVGHLSPRPRSSYDGLGDHRLSMSPRSPVSLGESVLNENHWETLLTTINDDALLHQSSFDSTRSNSEPDSYQSTQTAATSFGEIGSADDTCDLDLPQGITQDDVREIREQNRSRNQTHSGVSLERQFRDVITETPGGEMAMFQNLLTRLAQREDIPTEWWSAAGLARTVRENV